MIEWLKSTAYNNLSRNLAENHPYFKWNINIFPQDPFIILKYTK